MGWQPGTGRGTGEEPGRSLPARDPRLPGFAHGGEWDTCPPSAGLAAVLEAVSDSDWRCQRATRDELLGLLRQWQALESWAAAGKLGVLCALVREDDGPLPGGSCHGDLPDGWSKSLTHEVALALAMPPQSAERLMWTAWDLCARLPETGALLAAGTLTYAKARAVDDALAGLTDDDAAKAEAMIAADLDGKTYGQAEKLAVQAALTVDPDSATRRREEAERNRARIALRRDPSGAACLSGYDLPTDETLAAHANVCVRASEYQASGAFTGVRMDQFRAMAYLDLMNGVTAEARITAGQPPAGLGAPNEYGQDPGAADGDGRTSDRTPDDATPDTRPDGRRPDGHHPDTGGEPDDHRPDGHHPDTGVEPDDHRPDDHRPDDGERDDGSPGGDGPGGGSPPVSPLPKSPSPAPSPQPSRLADLVIPLTTLLGLGQRPGEGHGLGPLDPDLCRSLAAIAVNSPHTTLCVTVTDPDGLPVGHGCARPASRGSPGHPSRPSRPSQNSHSTCTRQTSPLAALPSTLNLTIPASRLPELASLPAGQGQGAWSFNPAAAQGPPGGY